MTEQYSADTLLDLLPCTAGDGDGTWQSLSVPLAAEAATLVDSDADAAARWLCAALMAVEAACTGGDTVMATLDVGDGLRQGRVDINDSLTAEYLLAALPPLQQTGPPEPAPWVVLHALTPSATPTDEHAHSRWAVSAQSPREVQVRFRAPLTHAAIAILANGVQQTLSELARDHERPLTAVDVLGDAQRRCLLHEWNDAPARRAGPDTLIARFDLARDSHLDAPAVIDVDHATVGYRQLDARADVVAQQLINAGVGVGELVAIAMPRGADAVAAVLGVLKVGAAYLPLDTDFPFERLAFMCADGNVSVALVGSAADATRLPTRVRCLRVTDATTSAVSASLPAVESTGDDLAYVMYTSGSTGTPKGVEVTQCAVVRLVCGANYLPLDADTRMLHAAPLGFDASTLEIWGALLNGGCIVVHDEAVPSGPGLAARIARHHVTTAWLTAALFNAVVDDDPQHLAGLHELITGGEALSVEHVRRMREAVPDVRLSNGYGPTECTTFTCTYAIDAVPDDARSIPIGRPITDTRVYLLNARREPVPIGVLGELYIGGVGLARGYRNRPDLNAERFVADPFGAPGERLYRTGDHARYRADGAIEFVGRSDGQVKIRGHRIELREIEAVLARHPQVRACVVLARADRPGDKRLVAYVVASSDDAPEAPALRAHLAARLPDFMVPAHYLPLSALPVTANGKLDWRALPAPDQRRPQLACAFEPAIGADEQALCALMAELLDIESVGRHDNFFELGGNSLLALRLLERMRRLPLANADASTPRLAVTAIFQHPTPAALAALRAGNSHVGIDRSRLSHAHRGGAMRNAAADANEPIAIIAMSGRFPGAADVEAFWDNLCAGRDSITRFSPEQLDPVIDARERNDPAYVAARGVIDGVEDFDAAFFAIPPRQAELMDPQHRLFLELCWECLERGGHAPDSTTVPVGVFAGMNNATYFQRHVAKHPELIEKVGAFQVMLDNEKDFITTRVAHKLNLTGPAISIHTACSTSLVAICQAVDSLRNGQCDMALAGGVSITCPPRSGYRYQVGAMLSPDGCTRTFDAKAQGTVFSDGAAVLLLKRLSDARADGNPVIALIRGGAVNNDGGNKASFSAPSSDGQAAVIAMALENADVDARSIGYVEAHGTATPVGDPIEIEGLRKAFADSSDAHGCCRIGSLKSNVGHLVIAAGAAGAIKAALALQQRRIPASIHFESANADLDLKQSPFVVQQQTCNWPATDAPRRAGVSSFGVGGTNAHVIMEEAPPPPVSDIAEGAQLLVLSARTPTALAAAAERLANHLQAHPDCNLADVAWTLAVGRKAFAHRLSVVADDSTLALAILRSTDTAAAIARSRPAHAREVVFMFPGQGAQYAGMGKALYAAEPAFHDALDACLAAVQGELAADLRGCLFGDDADALLPTAIMQPATFAIEYALARWWMSLGLKPAAMLGHSVGEFVAATLAGVFSLPDAIRLVAQRGALMQAQPAGAMLSVRLGAEAVLAKLPPGIALAAENAPGASVVAGPAAALSALQMQWEAEGIACRPLRTSHAFHSAMMDAVVEPFRQQVAAVARHAPLLPVMSTALADWLDADNACAADYWAQHLRRPVRFAAALARLLEAPGRVLLEVGPRTTLSTLARQQPLLQQHHGVAVASLSDAADRELSSLRAAVGQLWCQGVTLEPACLDRRQRRQRLCLPTYPFERQRHWVEAVAAPGAQVIPHPAIVAIAPVESAMPIPASIPPAHTPSVADERKPRLLAQLRDVFEDVAGFDMADADPQTHFIELGLDSLMLTQVALQLQKTFALKITFRQLMGEAATLDHLATLLDAQMPPEAATTAPAPANGAPPPAPAAAVVASLPGVSTMSTPVPSDYLRTLIDQQMQLMAQQLALVSGTAGVASVAAPTPLPSMPVVAAAPATAAVTAAAAPAALTDEETALAHTRYDVKKAFGAIARIDTTGKLELSARQAQRLDAFIARYAARTAKSKQYTQTHRPHMADPRVVNGFRPLTKEIVYQIVIERSKGAHLWDLDGNDYVDALNGFGMSLFGWQPDFVLDAVRKQLDLGYEIGPQHPLAGEVARRVCEVTGHDRAALCNTGSEAVLGALRIARTVTGRETVVLFNGAYHGIIDEMIVRGTKKLRAVPAAPGILRNTAEHVMVLDYGTPESLQIIREHAHELAAVLVEPVQSRRPDFQPVEFLRGLRQITQQAGALCIFDEVVTGFRAHPAGAQGLFGIQADLATYGKVVGGGYPIGVIAGKREFMDALDGGQWQFGDDSVPTVGVTYFAGTFVRHPLALAAADAVLQHVQAQGPALQERLNARVSAFVDELNAFCADAGAPIAVKHFASVWKTQFLEDHPLQDLLFAMMRSRGVHILDNFPCFYTSAHSEADFQHIAQAYKDSVIELQEAQFLPRRTATPRTVMDADRPPVPSARLGREPDGRPAWFVPHPEQAGQYLKVAR